MKNEEEFFSKLEANRKKQSIKPSENIFSAIFQQKPNPQNYNSKIVQLQQPSDIFASLNLRCKCNRPVALYCCSQNCIQNAIICLDFRSECMNIHKKCSTTMIADHFNEKINGNITKNINGKKTLEGVQKLVDKMTDEVSEMVTNLEQKFKLFGLNFNETNIYETISKKSKEQPEQIVQLAKTMNLFANPQRATKLTGDTFFEFNEKQKKITKRCIEDSIQVYQNVVKQTRLKVENYFGQVQNLLNCLSRRHVSKELNLNAFNNSFVNSRMFSTERHQENLFKLQIKINILEKILKDRVNVDSLRQVFSYKCQKYSKSSESELNAFKRLLERVDGSKNLLFLVQVQKKMRIGCFVPFVPFVPFVVGANEQDETIEGGKESFIFDLEADLSQTIEYSYSHIKEIDLYDLIVFCRNKDIAKSQNQRKATFSLGIFKQTLSVEMEMTQKAIKEKKKGMARNAFVTEEETQQVEDKSAKKNLIYSSRKQVMYLEVYEVKLKNPQALQSVKSPFGSEATEPVKNIFVLDEINKKKALNFFGITNENQ